MGIEVLESEPPVTKAKLAEVERIIGVELPGQYKAFLLEHNGGTPRSSDFLFCREGETPRTNIVAWFLAIHDGPHENFLDYFETFQGRIPTDTIPIARDPGGSPIVLGIRGPLRGKVFFWDRDELDSDDGTPTEPEMLYHVADSFDEFLKSLGKV